MMPHDKWFGLGTNVGINHQSTPFSLHHLSTNQRVILAAGLYWSGNKHVATFKLYVCSF